MLPIHRQSQHQITTAHLAQTMTLLSLSLDELSENIEKELSSNPALEMEEERRCPVCRRVMPEHGPCPVCSHPKDDTDQDLVVLLSPREDFYTYRETNDETSNDEPVTPMTEDLPTYVLRQIASELDPQDRKVAAYFLTHLDDDGLLTIPLMEIAMYFHIPLSRVAGVQKIVQRADPIGVGSNTTKDALLCQLDILAETTAVPEYARQIVMDGMDCLSRHQYTELAHRLEIPPAKVREAAHFITENLNPYPGRTHWGDSRQPSSEVEGVYHHPDILVHYLNGQPGDALLVEVVLPVRGMLRVNALYRQAIQEAAAQTKEDMRSDMERASLFVKCLQQRNHTMQRLMQRLGNLQRDFILKGEKYLKSVTRAQMARELGVHESTMSRAVAGKSVQLPNGRIIPLSSFFDRSLNVRTILKDIILQETRPLSDSDLVGILEKEGYPVARRTVAKYRAMEGILPAHLRQTTT